MDDDAVSALWGVPLAMLAGAIRVSTPFIFVSLGECLTERAGRINLGLEGTLVMGAMSGYALSLRQRLAVARRAGRGAGRRCCWARCTRGSAAAAGKRHRDRHRR